MVMVRYNTVPGSEMACVKKGCLPPELVRYGMVQYRTALYGTVW